MELCRYVVRNPARAGMVRFAWEYRWGSSRATAGLRATPALLYPNWLLAQCGVERSEAQRRYRRFVAESINRPAPWEALQGQIFLGQESFVQDMRTVLKRNHTGHH